MLASVGVNSGKIESTPESVEAGSFLGIGVVPPAGGACCRKSACPGLPWSAGEGSDVEALNRRDSAEREGACCRNPAWPGVPWERSRRISFESLFLPLQFS